MISYNEYMKTHPDESGLIHELQKLGVFSKLSEDDISDLELNYQLKYGDMILQDSVESIMKNLITPLEKLARMINLNFKDKWKAFADLDVNGYNMVTEKTTGNLTNSNKVSAYDDDTLIDDSGSESSQVITKDTIYRNISAVKNNVDLLTIYDTMLVDIKNYLTKHIQ